MINSFATLLVSGPVLCLLLTAFPTRLAAEDPPPEAASDDIEIPLSFVADLDPAGPGKENSGIVMSRQWDDVFWIHNDSGDEPRVYAVNRKGEACAKPRTDTTPGVLIGGAINVDWEDLTLDASGNLIVADVGNNYNDRRDLVLYHIREPAPGASRTSVYRRTYFHYPEQLEFPAPKHEFNYDCEGVFTVGDKVYLLTKHRSDTFTRMYEVDTQAEQPVAAKLVGSFDAGGKVTAADCSPDGMRLVMATYTHLWLFERNSLQENFFGSAVRCARYAAQQVEAVCFAGDDALLLADEELGKLYSARLADFPPPRSAAGSGPEAAGGLAVAPRNDPSGSVHQSPRVYPAEEEMTAFTPGAWTLAVLPDTQYYVDHSRKIPPTPEVFRAMTQWLADNQAARNIQLVLHVGDIVDNNTREEWEMAREALGPLAGKLPCVLATGNHDYTGNAKVRETLFNEFFPIDNHRLLDAKGPCVLKATMEPGRLENAAYEFRAPDGRLFLIISLEWGARDRAVEWANGLAGDPSYKGHTAVLLTHAYMYHDDTRYDWRSKGETQASNPLSYGTAATGDGNDGQMLWEKLVRRHPNFELVFCGHVTGTKEESMALRDDAEVGYLRSSAMSGKQVHQMLFNAQRQGDAGDGWLRLLEFQPDGRTVVVKTYSPWRDARGLRAWRTDADDYFRIELENFRR